MARKTRLLAAAIAALAMMWVARAQAAYLENVPTTLTQPDGTVLNCFISGDEFYHRVHDAAGFTIVPDPATGWYVYAQRKGDDLAPSLFKAGAADPAGRLQPGLMPAPERLKALHQGLPGMAGKGDPAPKAPATGSINNIVIFIRFADQSNYTDSTAKYNRAFNDSAVGAVSMRTYFVEASYNQLMIRTTMYPAPSGALVASYQDSHNRSYYIPYNASTAPDGYTGGDDGTMRTDREHALLVNAVNAVSPQIPAGLTVDSDNDGNVDNVCFIIQGTTTAWATLLWPHMWQLYTQTANINGKRVWDYNFQIQSGFGTSVLCHEMGHSIGLPDLYHYYTGTSLSPCGSWDLMCSNTTPPQHMGAYMKSHYAKWQAVPPRITASGTYWVKPMTSQTKNSYRIASPNSASEYFIVEYRRKTGTFETGLPGSGLLVYRINTTFADSGNAMYDGSTIFDEVYIYRPGGTTAANGTSASANYSSAVGRTAINNTSSPSCFLHDGSAGGLNISAIGAAGDSIPFTITVNPAAVELAEFTAQSSAGGVELHWRTESERDCYQWEIERSAGPEQGFAKIGGLEGQGSSSQPRDYSYNDRSLTEKGEYFYRLAEVDIQGTKTYYGPLSSNFGGDIPAADALSQCLPNPFDQRTMISYQLPNSGQVSLKIYNVLGQVVKTVCDGQRPAGVHKINWNGDDESGKKVSNGIYLYRLVTNGQSQTKKVIVLR